MWKAWLVLSVLLGVSDLAHHGTVPGAVARGPLFSALVFGFAYVRDRRAHR